MKIFIETGDIKDKITDYNWIHIGTTIKKYLITKVSGLALGIRELASCPEIVDGMCSNILKLIWFNRVTLNNFMRKET